jgi:hypothetical protein
LFAQEPLLLIGGRGILRVPVARMTFVTQKVIKARDFSVQTSTCLRALVSLFPTWLYNPYVPRVQPRILRVDVAYDIETTP